VFKERTTICDSAITLS